MCSVAYMCGTAYMNEIGCNITNNTTVFFHHESGKKKEVSDNRLFEYVGFR